MRGAVLEALELADQLAELLAFLEVVHRHVHRTLADADHLGRGAGAGRGEQRIENLAARIDLADHRVGIDFDSVERDMAREARVDQAARIGGQAFGVLRHREQSDAAIGLRRDDAHVGDMAVKDEAPFAVEAEAVAAPRRRGSVARGALLWRLHNLARVYTAAAPQRARPPT